MNARAGLPVVFLGLLSLAGAAVADDPDLRLGLVPHMAREDLLADYGPLAAYLGERLGRRVEVVVPDRYAAVYDALASGAIDLAVLPPFVYVEAVGELGAIPLATQVGKGGLTSYSSVLVVREGSRIAGLRDLAGRSFAFVDPKSSSGYLFPVALLVREGLEPTRLFSRTVFTGDHQTAIRMVLSGEVDGAATNDIVLAHVAGSGESPEGLRVLARSPAVPQQSLVARASLEAPLRQSIREALLAWQAPATAIDRLGWAPPEDRLYEEVRNLLAFRRERVSVGVVPGAQEGTGAAKLLLEALRTTGRFRTIASDAATGAFEGVAPADRTAVRSLVAAGARAQVEYWVALEVSGWSGDRARLTADLFEASGGERVETLQADVPDPGALGGSVDDLAKRLAGRFPARGFLVQIVDDQAVLDVGRREGVQRGDSVEFFVWGEPVKNPLTGRFGPRPEVRIGTATVLEADVELAYCRIGERSSTLVPGVWAKVHAEVSFAGAAAPTTGRLSVLSDPEGASIRIDGEDTGEWTPHTFEGLAPRDYVVGLVLEGYEEAKSVAHVRSGAAPTIVHQDLVPYWKTDFGIWALGLGGSLFALTVAWVFRRSVQKERARLALTPSEAERALSSLPTPLAQAFALHQRRREPLPPRDHAALLERLLAIVLVREEEVRTGRALETVDVGRGWWDLRDSLLAARRAEPIRSPWSAEVIGFYGASGQRWSLAGIEGGRLGDVLIRPSLSILRDLVGGRTVEDLLHEIQGLKESDRGGLLVEVVVRAALAAFGRWRFVSVAPDGTAIALEGQHPWRASLDHPIEGPGLWLVDAYERRVLDLGPWLVDLPMPKGWTGPRFFFLDRVVAARPESSEYVSFDRGTPERTTFDPEAWRSRLESEVADPTERADAIRVVEARHAALARTWATRRGTGTDTASGGTGPRRPT